MDAGAVNASSNRPPHQEADRQLAACSGRCLAALLRAPTDSAAVPAAEVLISTAAIRDCIENKEKAS
jgi:hypothetical protein